MSVAPPLAIDWDALAKAAIAVRENAHAPYSRYRVGAALLTASGAMFTACNVENASYGLAVCAERAAVVKMVSAGEREPKALVVVTSGPELGTPCGICRQTLAEFAGDDLPISIRSADGAHAPIETTLGALLPMAFRASALV